MELYYTDHIYESITLCIHIEKITILFIVINIHINSIFLFLRLYQNNTYFRFIIPNVYSNSSRRVIITFFEDLGK